VHRTRLPPFGFAPHRFSKTSQNLEMPNPSPELPPHLREKRKRSEDEDESSSSEAPTTTATENPDKKPRTIGPTLPPHLQASTADAGSESDSDDDFGPGLPSSVASSVSFACQIETIYLHRQAQCPRTRCARKRYSGDGESCPTRRMDVSSPFKFRLVVSSRSYEATKPKVQYWERRESSVTRSKGCQRSMVRNARAETKEACG
jgi:hypothetical protein